MNRYSRQIMLPDFGTAAQSRLGSAHVLVVGAGGLGSPVLQYLVAAGLGRIRLVDPDVIEESNLHRQTLFRMPDLGQSKAEVAAQTLGALNPDCAITPVRARLEAANVQTLASDVDLILDCADSFATSYTLSDFAFSRKLALISASVIGRQGYAGGFCGGAPSLRAVFPALPRRAGSCASEGVLGPVVGVTGSLQAQMAIAHLAQSGTSPLGRLVSFDAAAYRFGGFDFHGAEEPRSQPRFVSLSQIGPRDLLIDLREADEGPRIRADALRVTPDRIGPDTPIAANGGRTVLCCKSGLRAWHAAEAMARWHSTELALLATG